MTPERKAEEEKLVGEWKIPLVWEEKGEFFLLQLFYLSCVDLVQNVLLACIHNIKLCIFGEIPLLRRLVGSFWYLTLPHSSRRLLSKQADSNDSTT